MARRPILGLDLLRLAAALLVVGYHLSFHIGEADSPTYTLTRGAFHFDWAAGTTSLGRMGVEIFFVLSGFVIAYSANGMSPAHFLKSRILRLGPAAWICATMTLAVMLACHNLPASHLMRQWLRSMSFEPFGGQIDGAYWTLGVEIAFYALVLALLCLNRFAWIGRLAMAMTLVSSGFWIAAIGFPHSYIAGHGDHRFLQLLLVHHGAEFSVGILLWLLFFHRVTVLRLATLALALVGGSLEVTSFAARPQDELPAVGLWLFAVGLVVVSVLANERLHKTVGARGAAVVRVMGLATYPLYLIHQQVGAALMGVLARSAGLPPLACLAVATLAMIALALVVAMGLEPMIKAVLSPWLARLETWLSRLLHADLFRPTDQLEGRAG